MYLNVKISEDEILFILNDDIMHICRKTKKLLNKVAKAGIRGLKIYKLLGMEWM